MLEEKITELKNEKKKKTFTKIELEISYVLNDEFFASELDKLNFFREVENLETIEDLENFESDFASENTQENVTNLFLLLRARIIFGEFDVQKISKNGNFYVIDFVKNNSLENLKKFLDTFDSHKNMIVVSPEKLRIDAKIFANPRDFLQTILQEK